MREKQSRLGKFSFYMGKPDCLKWGRSVYRLMPGPVHIGPGETSFISVDNPFSVNLVLCYWAI